MDTVTIVRPLGVNFTEKDGTHHYMTSNNTRNAIRFAKLLYDSGLISSIEVYNRDKKKVFQRDELFSAMDIG